MRTARQTPWSPGTSPVPLAAARLAYDGKPGSPPKRGPRECLGRSRKEQQNRPGLMPDPTFLRIFRALASPESPLSTTRQETPRDTTETPEQTSTKHSAAHRSSSTQPPPLSTRARPSTVAQAGAPIPDHGLKTLQYATEDLSAVEPTRQAKQASTGQQERTRALSQSAKSCRAREKAARKNRRGGQEGKEKAQKGADSLDKERRCACATSASRTPAVQASRMPATRPAADACATAGQTDH